jgi:DNA-binding LytR/AlgR family response regulator
MKLKTVILDDEPYARDILQNYAHQCEHLELVQVFVYAEEALIFLQANEVDLILLDIEMPGMTGLQFLKTLSKPPKVIITTAYRQYALEGFELNVVDYLVKPFSFERFIAAIGRLFEYSVFSASAEATDPDFLYFKSSGKLTKVYLKDILYIEGLSNYVKIVMVDGTLIVYQKLSYLEEKLPKNQFIRVHRSYIISTEHIQSVGKSEVSIMQRIVPIGSKYRENLAQLKSHLFP